MISRNCFTCIVAILSAFVRTNAETYDGYTRISNNAGLSNSSVTAIFQDSHDLMWFGTWNGLNRYDGMAVKQYRPQPSSGTSISHQVIRSISEDAEGYLWIATDFGINRMDRGKETFSEYDIGYDRPYIYEEGLFSCCVSRDGTVAAALKGGNIRIFDYMSDSFIPAGGCDSLKIMSVLFFDDIGRLWAMTSEGSLATIFLQDGYAEKIRLTDLPEDCGRPMYDGNGRIWMQHSKGVAYMDIYKEQPVPEESRIKVRSTINTVRDIDRTLYIGSSTGCFRVNDGSLERITGTDISVLSISKGTQDILWLGTDGQGVLKENYIPEFMSTLRSPVAKNFPVRAILIDQDGNIYTGSKGGGLSVTGPDGKAWRSYNVGPGRTYNSVLSLAREGERIYIGTDGYGLKFMDRRDMVLRSLDFSGSGIGKDIISVYSIEPVGKDTLYLGTSGNGLFRVVLDEESVRSVENFRHSDSDWTSIGSNIIYDLVNDGRYLWIATRGGGLNRFDKKTGRNEIVRDRLPAAGKSCNDVLCLLLDSSGRLWAGTSSGLYMIPEDPEDTSKLFDETSGLPNTDIHAILEGSDSTVWVSTDRGIARIGKDAASVTSWSHNDGLSDNEYSDGAGFSADGGARLYFGSVAGVDVIEPELVQEDNFMPKLSLSMAEVDNARYYPVGNMIDTHYRTGSISLWFSLPDYVSDRKSSIAYHLKRGRDKSDRDLKDSEWIDMGSSRRIIISRLRPGHYTLLVRAMAGKETGEPQAYSISISWPRLLSPWFIVIYICLSACVTIVLYRMHRSRKAIFEELEKEKRDSAVKEEIVRAKLRFFTNIAHEFSNSITLIFGAVEQIFSMGGEDSRSRKQLIAIRSNADRMHRQIQELMEFSKADSGHLPVMYEKVDVNELIKYTSDNFIDITESKKINFSICVQDTLPLWVSDRSMLEKIVFNLMSNAMKYTPAEGWIEISASQDRDAGLVISVRNSGPGIAPDEIKGIFDRYVILDNFETKLSRGHYTRTGIGLALCKDLAELLGGRITADSRINEYTVFTVTLPWKDEANIPLAPVPLPEVSGQGAGHLSGQGAIVLVVDDFADIRTLICDILSDGFDTVQAPNAEKAIEIMKKVTPSLIICDMIMPGMGGMEFVKKVKTDERTSHIPVVIMSSNSDIENRVGIINMGADMFIAKPFHPRYLRAVVERMLANSRNPVSGVRPLEAAIDKVESDGDGKDTSFTDKVMEALSKNFSDENYNQDALAYDMAMSRVQLYRKVKHDLETTPGELIRRYRIKRAELMLRETDKTVQEIMYDCGFHNKAYFYREFSRLHNCSPKDFRNKG